MTREDDLEALATANAWTFSIEDHDDLISLPFRMFSDGVSQSVSDVIEGARDGRDVLAFDYAYGAVAMGMLEAPTTFETSCAVVALPAICPELMISRETAGHWLTHPLHHEAFAHERTDFARGFRITTADPAFAAAVFDYDVERWFLEELPDRDLCFEIAGSWLLCFTHRREPDQVPMVMDAAVAFASRIPPAAFDGLPVPSV